MPNYFDDQRFGSVGFGGGFIAEAWLRGDHERALYLALAEPNPMDRPDTRVEKEILRECWGRWAEAKARLDRSHARSLVTYLVDHPEDFRGAFARVPSRTADRSTSPRSRATSGTSCWAGGSSR